MTFTTTKNELFSFDADYLWVTKRIPMPVTVKLRLKHGMTVMELITSMENIKKLDDEMFRMMSENEVDLRSEEEKIIGA